jgi:hypothetical protein
MTDRKETVVAHVNVEVTTTELQAIVENTKKRAGRSSNGIYRIDTADKISRMICLFLPGNDFENYANDISNYKQSNFCV